MTYHQAYLNMIKRRERYTRQLDREDYLTELLIDKSKEERVCNLCGQPSNGNHDSCENYENRPLPDKE